MWDPCLAGISGRVERTAPGGRGRAGAAVRIEEPLPHTAEGPRLARRRLEAALGRDLDPELLGELAIIASELVANSVVHGRPDGVGSVVFRIDADARRIRLEAEDRGRILRRPRARGGSESAPGGRGLRLVDALADRWGVSRGRPTIVWTEIDVLGERRGTGSVSDPARRPRTARPSR